MSPQLDNWYVHPADRCTPRPVSWLWQARFPEGKLVLLEGDPGLGKSLVTLDISARLTTGRPMPDGSPTPTAANVLVLNGEDSDEDTILPRLQSLGAACERVFLLKFKGPGQARLSLPSHLELLGTALRQSAARLVIIDPVSAFLDHGICSNSDQSIRRVLAALGDLAEELQVTVLMVRHLNKQTGLQALYRGAGSIGMIGACRSAWLIARDPHSADRCILAQLKNNLAAAQCSLAYQFHQEGTTPPSLTWLGPSPWTADQLVAVARCKGLATAPKQRAGEMLKEFLAQGPRPARIVWDWAYDEGISNVALNRAKKRLDIRSEVLCDGPRRQWYWLLPHQTLPSSAAPDQPTAEIEAWLKQLREQFPRSSPLEEPL